MTPARARRLRRRLLRHHLVLAVLAVGGGLLFQGSIRSPDPLFRASLTSAYVALGLLGVTLLTGPVDVLRGRPVPVSTDLRRDVGIWAAIVGLVHVVLGLQVHLRGRWWLYFVYGAQERRRPLHSPVRLDPFGVANHTGLLAALLLVLLLAISNDLALRRLGSRRWKRLQRWNYVVAGLVVGHSFAYQFVEGRGRSYVIAVAGAAAVLAAAQLLGYRRRRRRQPAGAP